MVKIKVVSSIVAISSIHLLTVFLNLQNSSTREQNIWLVIMHLTFVLSALCLCIMDRISSNDAEFIPGGLLSPSMNQNKKAEKLSEPDKHQRKT